MSLLYYHKDRIPTKSNLLKSNLIKHGRQFLEVDIKDHMVDVLLPKKRSDNKSIYSIAIKNLS